MLRSSTRPDGPATSKSSSALEGPSTPKTQPSPTTPLT